VQRGFRFYRPCHSIFLLGSVSATSLALAAFIGVSRESPQILILDVDLRLATCVSQEDRSIGRRSSQLLLNPATRGLSPLKSAEQRPRRFSRVFSIRISIIYKPLGPASSVAANRKRSTGIVARRAVSLHLPQQRCVHYIGVLALRCEREER
jgi:hypothetical protein